MPKAIFLNSHPDTVFRVYAEKQMARLRSLVELDETIYTSAEHLRASGVRDAEFVFSTWGMLSLTEEEIAELLPQLKAVFYGAGSVQSFARPFLNRGVRVFSAWQANGTAVAQFTFSQILLASKGYFRMEPFMRNSDRDGAARFHQQYPGGYGVKVGLLGVGAIGSQVAEWLKLTDCEVWAYDPFLPEERARQLNVRLTTMEDIFRNCLIVSNHLANLPETVGIIRREHFMSMPPYSTFINTGRGAQLTEQDLADALAADSTRTALLDVVTDEAHWTDSPLAHLPNCLLTPHMAGASGLEVRRMADFMLSACEAVQKGEPVRSEVFPKMLETMA